MSPVQTTYSETQAKGFPGQRADATHKDADSRICETAAGIGFGLAVGQGTADNGGVLGGAIDIFVGVSLREPALPASNEDKYLQYDIMSIAFDGDVFVTAGAEVSAGDPVHYNATTGVFTNTGGSGPIKGARWMTSAAASTIGIIRLPGRQGNT